MQRREFLKLSSTGILSLFLSKFSLPVYAQSSKILILVELKGGNDGLNTVIPYKEQLYYNLRPNISINSDSVLRLSDNLGLNPSMSNLMKIWQDKEMAIIQGVGYPDPNRSHFRSIEIWETASNSQETLQDGWIARAFLNSKNIKREIDGIIMGQGDEGALSGLQMNNLVMSTPEKFIKDAKKFKSIINNSDNQSLNHVVKIESEIYKSSYIIEDKLKNKIKNKTSFPNTSIGKQFATAADIVINNIPVSVIKLEHGSFDTHTNQRANQDRLLKELSDAIYHFRESMKNYSKWNDVVILTYSEFGRRVGENGSRGTDHGTAAPHFAIGGKVKGGFYGKTPDLNNLVNGDLKYTIDYRNLYSTIAKMWWNISPEFLLKYSPIDFIIK